MVRIGGAPVGEAYDDSRVRSVLDLGVERRDKAVLPTTTALDMQVGSALLGFGAPVAQIESTARDAAERRRKLRPRAAAAAPAVAAVLQPAPSAAAVSPALVRKLMRARRENALLRATVGEAAAEGHARQSRASAKNGGGGRRGGDAAVNPARARQAIPRGQSGRGMSRVLNGAFSVTHCVEHRLEAEQRIRSLSQQLKVERERTAEVEASLVSQRSVTAAATPEQSCAASLPSTNRPKSAGTAQSMLPPSHGGGKQQRPRSAAMHRTSVSSLSPSHGSRAQRQRPRSAATRRVPISASPSLFRNNKQQRPKSAATRRTPTSSLHSSPSPPATRRHSFDVSESQQAIGAAGSGIDAVRAAKGRARPHSARPAMRASVGYKKTDITRSDAAQCAMPNPQYLRRKAVRFPRKRSDLPRSPKQAPLHFEMIGRSFSRAASDVTVGAQMMTLLPYDPPKEARSWLASRKG